MLHPVFRFPDGREFIFPYAASKKVDMFYAKLESESIRFACMREYWDGENFASTSKYVIFTAAELKSLTHDVLEIVVIGEITKLISICILEKDLQTAI